MRMKLVMFGVVWEITLGKGQLLSHCWLGRIMADVALQGAKLADTVCNLHILLAQFNQRLAVVEQVIKTTAAVNQNTNLKLN